MVTGFSRTEFHSKRSMALFRPVKALAQLGPYARLHLKVIKARELEGEDLLVGDALQFWKKEKEKTADPYVKVLLNDVELCNNKENYCHRTTEPVWNWDAPVLDIKSAASVVRIEIMDLDHLRTDDLCGFVEFFVADLPPGETLSGWFHLSPKTALTRRAPFRIKGASAGRWSGRGGAVYAQVRLEIVSGLRSDEWYAHCLPQPKLVSYPMGGFTRESEPFDAQAVYDRWTSFATTLVEDLVTPVISGALYFCSCRDPGVALLCVSTAVACWIFPRDGLCILFVATGIFFSCLSRTRLRRRIWANPLTVTLDQAGFESVALLDDPEDMLMFVERVVHAMSGRVVDKDRLLEFAEESFDYGRVLFDYATLRQKLRDEAKLKLPFVHFDRAQCKEGSMVEVKGRVGQIVECCGQESGHRIYTVEFLYEGKWKEAIPEEDLDMHMDLQWLNNHAVRMFTPKFLERRVLQVEERIEDLDDNVKYCARISHGIVSWTYCRTSLLIFLLFMALGGSSAYAIRSMNEWHFLMLVFSFWTGLILAVTICACVALNECCRCCRAYQRALRSSRQHRRKNARNWPFFQEDPYDFPT